MCVIHALKDHQISLSCGINISHDTDIVGSVYHLVIYM